MNAVSASWEEIILEWSRPEVSIDNVTWLAVSLYDPLSKLHGIGYGSRQENVSHFVWQEDDGLFPDDTSDFVSEIMNLVEDDPAYFTHDLGPPIQHGPQNFGCHDQTGGCGVDCNISGHEANITKFGLELSVFLIA